MYFLNQFHRGGKLLLFILVLCILSINIGISQPPSIAELKEEVHPKFEDASAKYILNNSKVRFQFTRGEKPRAFYEFHQRIKIYDEEALDLADYQIYFLSGFSDERVYDIEAVVYNTYDDGSVTSDKLEKSNIYDSKEEGYFSKKFALPNVQEGSIIDVKYKLNTANLYTIKRHFFQFDIPVDNSVMIVDLPPKLSYNPIFTGTHKINTAQKDNNFDLPHSTIFTISAVDVPPIIEDEYVLNINDYRTSMKYELHTFTYDTGAKESYAKSWESLARDMHREGNFGQQLRKKVKPIKHIVEEAKALSEAERPKFLYDYVRENYTWNNKYGILTENGIKKTLKTSTGNVADLNILLTNLLIRSGIDAKPLIIKSRWRGVLNPEYPSLTEPNYVLVHIKIDEESHIVDATDKTIPYGQLPLRAINTLGISLYDKKVEMVPLTNPNIYSSQNLYTIEYNEESNSLKGVNTGRFSNYAATKARLEAKKEDNDNQDLKQNDEDVFEGILIENVQDIYNPISFEQKVELSSTIQNIENNLIIGAFVKNLSDENQFTQYKRKYPVFFNYLIDIKNVVKLKIPEGYKLESKPEDLSVALPKKDGVFHYAIKEMDNSLMINYSLKIDKLEFSPYEYPQLREFMKKIYAKQNEKIILAK